MPEPVFDAFDFRFNGGEGIREDQVAGLDEIKQAANNALAEANHNADLLDDLSGDDTSWSDLTEQQVIAGYAFVLSTFGSLRDGDFGGSGDYDGGPGTSFPGISVPRGAPADRLRFTIGGERSFANVTFPGGSTFVIEAVATGAAGDGITVTFTYDSSVPATTAVGSISGRAVTIRLNGAINFTALRNAVSGNSQIANLVRFVNGYSGTSNFGGSNDNRGPYTLAYGGAATYPTATQKWLQIPTPTANPQVTPRSPNLDYYVLVPEADSDTSNQVEVPVETGEPVLVQFGVRHSRLSSVIYNILTDIFEGAGQTQDDDDETITIAGGGPSGGITQTAADARYVRSTVYTPALAAINSRLRGELVGFSQNTTYGGDSDWGKILQFFGSNARTLTLPNLDSAWQGHRFFLNNNASATLTIAPHSTDQINLGGAGNTATLLAGELALVFAANPAPAGNWTVRKIDIGGVQFSAIDKAKLDSVELGATVDQSGTDIVGLLEGLSGNNRLQASAIRGLSSGGAGPYSLQRVDYVDSGSARDIFDSGTASVNEALYGTIYTVDTGGTFTFDIDPDGNYGYGGGTLAFNALSGSSIDVQIEGRTLVTVPEDQFVQIIYEPDGAGAWLVTTQTPFADIQSSLAHKIEHLEEITRGLSIDVVDETWARAGNALTNAGVYVSATALNLTQVRALNNNVWQTRINLSNRSGYVYLRLPHAADNAEGRIAFTHRGGSQTANVANTMWMVGNTADGSTAKFFGFYATRGQTQIITPEITRVEAQVGTGIEEPVFRGGLGVSAWPDTSGTIITITAAQNRTRIAASTATIEGKIYVVT